MLEKADFRDMKLSCFQPRSLATDNVYLGLKTPGSSNPFAFGVAIV